MIDFI